MSPLEGHDGRAVLEQFLQRHDLALDARQCEVRHQVAFAGSIVAGSCRDETSDDTIILLSIGRCENTEPVRKIVEPLSEWSFDTYCIPESLFKGLLAH